MSSRISKKKKSIAIAATSKVEFSALYNHSQLLLNSMVKSVGWDGLTKLTKPEIHKVVQNYVKIYAKGNKRLGDLLEKFVKRYVEDLKNATERKDLEMIRLLMSTKGNPAIRSIVYEVYKESRWDVKKSVPKITKKSNKNNEEVLEGYLENLDDSSEVKNTGKRKRPRSQKSKSKVVAQRSKNKDKVLEGYLENIDDSEVKITKKRSGSKGSRKKSKPKNLEEYLEEME